MFFKRKGYIRKELDSKLLGTLLRCKKQWERQKKLVDASIDPSFQVLTELKLAETKYMYLLREARNRRISMK